MSIIPLCTVLSITSCILFSESVSCILNNPSATKFDQKVSRFWEFNNQTSSWVEVKLPYDLVSCINDDCTVVASIQETVSKKSFDDVDDGGHDHHQEPVENSDEKGTSDKEKHGLSEQETTDYHQSLPLRKRVSLTRMSETSIWITGESGSIYERFWNGIQWAFAPHDLPLSAGYAVSVFMVNQTILALSDNGFMYRMHLNEESQPVWAEFVPEFDKGTTTSKGTDQNSAMHVISGILSNSREKIYFCTKNGLLLELTGVDPPRWVDHGRPPGAKAAVITDADMIRPELLFVLSSVGDLYEYDRASKPPWKKHIHREGSKKRNDDTSLIPNMVCASQGLFGSYSVSLFLLSKRGELLERRLSRRKWKWIEHGNPRSHPLTSITCNSHDDHGDNPNSLFLTSASGSVFEYRVQESPGHSKDQDFEGNWVNHMHPPHAYVARGISGLQIHFARTIFPLHDGRLGELHLSGFGGVNLSPNPQIITRRKSLLKYVWSIIDAPESEGWNAEYCTEERGPSNCLVGTKDETSEPSPSSSSRRRKDVRTQHNYLLPSISTTSSEEESYNATQDYKTIVKQFFRLRLMQEGRSFFLITDNGLTFEYLNTESVWFWLRHEHSKKMEGIVGNYNASLFLVDEHGSLLVRERSRDELGWVNCTEMRKGKRVIAGSPWDVLPGRGLEAKPEDSIFLVSKSGRLLQLTVALNQYKWKDCKNPPNTKIAIIADQEGFRDNVVFVIAKNGRLYQYNKVTELWHEHYQSQHLVLSRSPGTSMRSSSSLSSLSLSVEGSIFMLSENGGLVEYKYTSLDRWDWIEHGTPNTNVSLAGATGPCFKGGELFLIGSDGNVYLRYLDLNEWKWRDCGFPHHKDDDNVRKKAEAQQKDEDEQVCAADKELEEGLIEINRNCNSKVASTRPIPFSEDSIIFELQDGRLAEMKRMEDRSWIWSRTIDTPTSSCMASFWTSIAS